MPEKKTKFYYFTERLKENQQNATNNEIGRHYTVCFLAKFYSVF